MNGKVVQLVQGKKENKEVEVADYDKIISKFKPFGTIQLIDLDAAMGCGNNYDLIKKITKKIKCRIGGGIRTVEDVEKIASLGVKVIVGSPVFRHGQIYYDFLKKLVEQIPKDRLIIAIDTINEEIVVNGWSKKTGINVFSAIKNLEPYCTEFLATYVDKEGMLKGTNLGFFQRLRAMTVNDITAAGGISTLEEINNLESMNINSALGMAVYKNRIKLSDLVKINNKLFK
ncbi:MAG: HisA/HisF-related TIM barrel protein [Nanoarchaeota archaeon]